MTALHAAGGGLPLALHIPHVVEQAGSIAGFASVLGLAILSALYFSQARDLRRLREWAGRAPERAAEAQPSPVPGRVVAVPQQPRPAGAPAPAAATAAAAAAPANGEPAKQSNGEAAKQGDEAARPAEAGAAATNGDAAPLVAAGAADKDSQDQGDGAKVGGAPAAKPGMPAPASAAAAAAGAGAKSVAGPAAPESPSTPSSGQPASGGGQPGSPSTPASGQPASGGGQPGSPSAVAPAPAPASPGSGSPAAAGSGAPAPAGSQAAPAPAAAAGAAAAAGTAAAGSASAPRPGAAPQRPPGSVLPPRTGTLPPVRRLPSSNVGPATQTGILGQAPQPKKKRNPLYVALAVAGVLVLGAAAAIGVPALVNGSKDNNSSTPAAATTAASSRHRASAVTPDKITVAVLNGTSVSGLAAQVGDRVDAEGFKLGTVSNASQTSGQRANSVAQYAPGHEADAKRVARRLGISNVERVDPGTQAIAGDASVVVIVGADKTQ